MPEETKKRKCRNCAEEHEVGKPCPKCEWDEEKAQQQVRKSKLLADIQEEQKAADKNKGKGSSKSSWGW